MRIKIDAVDTLFFKDGKPFNMGDESWADGIFPPPLSVIAGALRTAYFSYHPGEIGKAGELDDPTAGLQITGLALIIGEQVYYPAPLDMVVDQSVNPKGKRRLESLQLAHPTGVTSSPLQKNLSFPKESKIESAQGLLIDSMSLTDWLKGTEKKIPFLSQSELVITEPKTGIGRENNSRSASEGKLYRVGMRRPVTRVDGGEVKFSIVVEFSGIELPGEGFFKLGGEGKVAKWSEFDKNLIPSVPELPSDNDKVTLRLYLLTPGIFESGSMPTLPEEIKSNVVAASNGKALHLGGYDMKNNCPKPMKLAIPAGSVYFIECEKEEAGKILALHGQSLSNDEYAKQGYGIVLVGVKNA